MNSVRDGKENPALANNNIRKALAQAFDKESFVKKSCKINPRLQIK